jgi:hypothetical protein
MLNHSTPSRCKPRKNTPKKFMPRLSDGKASKLNATLRSMIEHQISTPEGYLAFTVFLIGSKETTAMLRNFLYHMRRVHAHRHLLLVGLNTTDCDAIKPADVHCHVDDSDYLIRNDTYIYYNPQTTRAVNIKYWYAAEFLRLGFHPFFMDIDILPMRQFFSLADPNYDIQGLSDQKELMLTDGFFNAKKQCGVDYQESYIPCQSTGFWVAHSNARTVRVMETMLTRLQRWEQWEFNVVIIENLIGYGNYQPLRYSIFNHSSVANCNMFMQALERANYTAEPVARLVVFHLGYVHGSHKREVYQQLNIWQGNRSIDEFWNDHYEFPNLNLDYPHFYIC